MWRIANSHVFPHIGDAIQVLQTTPQRGRVRFKIAIAAENSTRVTNPSG